MLPCLEDTTQTVSFTESEDGVINMTGEVYAKDVVVMTNAGTHSHGSSKVKLRSLVDYSWEPRANWGQLLAVHIGGKYFAYCIRAQNAMNPGAWRGMVRVVYTPKPGTDARVLVKGMKAEVQDVSFAHIQSQAVLASIDELGNVYVHEIQPVEKENKVELRCTLIMEIREDTMPPGVAGSAPHRVVWCPYIPDVDDDGSDDEVARLLLTTHLQQARMWNMRTLVKYVQAPECIANASELLTVDGVRTASEHTAPIVDAAFSPDGTALATASEDGFVMFFQVYMHSDGAPRCLHRWQPHAGKPLSCLFFLDNHKQFNTDVQFWKFAVTGADNNTTIKIWSCKSWICMQTITFTPAPGIDPGTLGLRAMLDKSASYLLLSDFRARSLYVLSMARDTEDTGAHCKTISEFLLPYPVLSFCITDADEEVVECDSRCDDPFHRNGNADGHASPDDFDRDVAGGDVACSGPVTRVRLRLFIMQPKGLQEGELVYTPPPTPAHRARIEDVRHDLVNLTLEDTSADSAQPIASSILQQQSQQLKNLLMRSQTQPGSLIGQRPESPPLPSSLNLMTPDAFSSPGKRDEDDPPLSATPDVGKRVSTTGVSDDVPEPECKLVSAGSSPSREVQEIMAQDGAFYQHNLEEMESSQTPVTEEVPSAVPNGVEAPYPEEPPYPAEELFSSPEKPPQPAAKLTHTNSDTSWPQISLEQITEANQRKASSDKSANQSLNNSLSVSAERAQDEVRGSGLSPADRTRLEVLENKLDKLCDLVTQQSAEVRLLRGEVSGPRAAVDEALHAHTQRTAAAVDTALTEGWDRIARVGEAASSRAATAAGVGAARALEPLAAALKHELAAKLSATDQLLRDNIEKLANSKTVMDRLSTSIAKSLSEMVRESFRSALTESVVPGVERAHALMFRQLNQAFQSGTKEFAANTEAASRAAAERGAAAAVSGLRAALDRHAEALAADARAQPDIADTIKEVAHNVLEKELCWWREQARAVAVQMSRAHSPATPASHVSAADRQMQVAQIQSLMSAGDLNGAFQLALSASDLALVVAACRKAEPARVFGPPCRLKQHVLLSLVQQLAADMARDTHLKHRYLEEAIMNLDTSNPVTREHLPVVVRELQKQIVAFLNANPAHALTRQFRMLIMATDSLVKSSV